MTKLTKSDSERAHYLRQEIINLRISATEQFFRLGEVLKEVQDKEYWRMGYESFTEYFSDPEFSLKKSTVYHAIKLFETFADQKPLLDIPVSKLIMIAPHVTEKNKDEMVEAARGLSRGDLRHELGGEIGQPISEPGLPKVYKCETCFRAKGIGWSQLCHCGLAPAQIEYIGKLIEAIEYD